jgi:8-oxo-dGTP diphosphatase
METSGEPSHELMDDVRAVDWLPLEAAVERLSRACERAFLANVGPLALEAAAFARRSKARKPPALVKRGRRPSVVPQPPLAIPAPIAPPPDVMPSPPEADLPLMVGNDLVEVQLIDAPSVEARSSDCATALEIAPESAREISAVTAAEPEPENEAASATGRDRHVNLVQIVRDWLWRAA